MADVPQTTPDFSRRMHVAYSLRFLRGLPHSAVEADCARMMIAYYCLSALDLLSGLDQRVTENERNDWKAWIWAQQVSGPEGIGFRSSPFLGGHQSRTAKEPPHILMTYTALLSLAVLRDQFTKLDRAGLNTFIRSTQAPDGSFLPTVGSAEKGDIRIVYAALAVCHMLDDWSGIEIDRTVHYVNACRAYDGGYGQTPMSEANGKRHVAPLLPSLRLLAGGATYCAVAALTLVSRPLQGVQKEATLRWLVQRQLSGFQGRTDKELDACYSFWCGAAISLLGGAEYVDPDSNARFLHACQFKLGGFAKAIGELPDPLHSYLSLASLSLYRPSWSLDGSASAAAYQLGSLDALLNARTETAEWVRKTVSKKVETEILPKST